METCQADEVAMQMTRRVTAQALSSPARGPESLSPWRPDCISSLELQKLLRLQSPTPLVAPISQCEVRSLLNKILHNEHLLESTARHSYVHQLGFEKYVLAQSEDGCCLRLHYWPEEGFQNATEDIHSHCANFVSSILRGTLTHRVYELKPGSSHSVYSYQFDSDSNCSSAHRSGFTSATPMQDFAYKPGETYVIEAEILHQVTNVEPGTITVSAWGPRRTNAIVIKPAPASTGPCNCNAGLPVGEVRDRLKKIMELIKNDSKQPRH